MTKLLYDIYEQFTGKAAAGRKMSPESLEKLARGRVYTGMMAVNNHLVDELGTLEDAVAATRKLANISEETKTERLILPAAVSPLEALFGPIDPNARASAEHPLLQQLRELSPDFWQTWRQFQLVQLLSREPTLYLLPYQIRVR